MPNRSIRDLRQGTTPLAIAKPRLSASPVMGQPMSRPVMTAPIARPTPIGAPNRGGRSQVPQQLAAGPVPEAASIAAGMQVPKQVAMQPREPVATVQGAGGATPQQMVR